MSGVSGKRGGRGGKGRKKGGVRKMNVDANMIRLGEGVFSCECICVSSG